MPLVDLIQRATTCDDSISRDGEAGQRSALGNLERRGYDVTLKPRPAARSPDGPGWLCLAAPSFQSLSAQ